LIDHETLSQFLSDEIQRGSIRTPCWESVPVEPTGRRNGSLVEYSMQGIAGEWWSIETTSSGSHRGDCSDPFLAVYCHPTLLSRYPESGLV